MQKKRVMVIDDDKEILDIISIILNNHGYEAVTFTSGNGIIEKIKEIKPKVILLDIQLGIFDGRLICKQIKEIEEHSTTPVILFSANIHYAKNVREYMCDDFLEKPFEIISLIEMINKHINTLS
ncbi:MAG: response regulator [Ginsengibacter sp.]